MGADTYLAAHAHLPSLVVTAPFPAPDNHYVQCITDRRRISATQKSNTTSRPLCQEQFKGL
jgi:hypothetical protein